MEINKNCKVEDYKWEVRIPQKRIKEGMHLIETKDGIKTISVVLWVRKEEIDPIDGEKYIEIGTAQFDENEKELDGFIISSPLSSPDPAEQERMNKAEDWYDNHYDYDVRKVRIPYGWDAVFTTAEEAAAFGIDKTHLLRIASNYRLEDYWYQVPLTLPEIKKGMHLLGYDDYQSSDEIVLFDYVVEDITEQNDEYYDGALVRRVEMKAYDDGEEVNNWWLEEPVDIPEEDKTKHCVLFNSEEEAESFGISKDRLEINDISEIG